MGATGTYLPHGNTTTVTLENNSSLQLLSGMFNISATNNLSLQGLSSTDLIVGAPTTQIRSQRQMMLKQYELSNHLGNVLATITDYKLGKDLNFDDIADAYLPQMVNYTDYYPFGGPMLGRVYSGGDYRYGFNGKDKDVEVSGVGNHQNYGLRIYFPRLARFLSVDPWTKNYPVLTPYQFASNLPIAAIDLDGAEAQRVVEGSVIHGPMDIRVVNEKRIKSNPGLIFNPLPSSNHTFLYNNPQPPSSQGGGCDYCDKIEPYKEVPDPVRKANAANRAVKEYKAKADPLFFGNKNPASNNPIGLVPGINTGATQVPMLLFEEYVFAKAYNFFSKPPMEWGAFRSANKDVFKGPNHMKEASQALKKYKQYNQNVETALNYADLILTVQGLLDGSAESADEATSGSGSSSGISIPNTQAVLDATKLGPKKQ